MEDIILTCIVRKLHRIENTLSALWCTSYSPLTHSKNACVGSSITLHLTWMNTFRVEHT